MRLPRPCITCGELTYHHDRCEQCAPLKERARGSSTSRGLGHAWTKKRQRVLKRDRYTCQLLLSGCTLEATSVDHIVPRAYGGSDDLDNLQAACSWCNTSKGARTI